MGSVGHNNMYMYWGMPCFTEISDVALFFWVCGNRIASLLTSLIQLG